MFNESNDPAQRTEASEPAAPRNRRGRVLGLAATGVVAGLLAIGATNVAQAQESPSVPPVAVEIDSGLPEADPGGVEVDEDAVWEAFDACMTAQGLDIDALEAAEDAGTLTEADEEALDAAFETCDAQLIETFGEDIFADHDDDIDDAVWEAFDACMAEQGLDIDALEAAEDAGTLTEADEQALDAAFETCDAQLIETFGEDIFADDEFGCDDPEDDDDLDDGDTEDDDVDGDDDTEGDTENS